MRVKRLKITGLTKHQGTELELPAAGLVVITGDNGSGKSSIIEAVHVCRWGKSLRGTDVWAGPGEVEMELHDGPTYVRKRTSSGRTTLKTKDGPEFQTAARAKRELGGDPKLWQRSCVFSFEDVVSFTRATDSERKKMLEAVLGLERFDQALKACREELAAARKEETDAAHGLEMAQQAYESAVRLHDEVEAQLAEQGPEYDHEAASAQLRALEEQVRVATVFCTDIGKEATALREQSAELKAEKTQLEKKIKSEGSAECHACGRPFDEHRGDVVTKLREELAGVVAQSADITTKGQALVKDQRRYQEEASEASEEVSRIMAETEAASKADEQRAKLAGRLRVLGGEMQNADAGVADGRDLLTQRQGDTAVLDACAKVLGLKGLRSHVLAEALQGLEIAANYWLERFAPGVAVTIRPCRELKGGGTSDEISVEMTGVAGGHGYKGSSRGERRRQDVAITWALGEVEAAATGQAESTVWCDEPFDGLDDPGVDALVAALDEVRERRCVVVISHSASLVEALRPDAHYHVTEGVVDRRR